jgi:hypothetical protein
MNAGVVNVKGAVVNAPGGGGLGGTPIAGGGKSTLGKVAGGIGKYVLGPAGAVIAGSEIAAQINAPKINPALDFEKQQLQVKLDSDDLKSLEATLSTLKSARDTSTGKDPLKEIAIGLSYVPFISDALGHIGPELDSQIKEVQKKIDELKAAQKASNTVTDGILNHNADEHNAVVTRANQQASQSVTRQIQSHAASERSDLRDLVHQERRVAAVVEEEVGTGAVGPEERLLRAPPVLLQRLALPGEDGSALGVVHRPRLPHHHGRGGVVLGREDVARDPPHVRAQLHQRLDEHGGLNGHVQRSHDLRAGQRTRAAVLLAQRHQPRHLLLRQADLLTPEFGLRQIADLEGLPPRVASGREGVDGRIEYCAHHRLSVKRYIRVSRAFRAATRAAPTVSSGS